MSLQDGVRTDWFSCKTTEEGIAIRGWIKTAVLAISCRGTIEVDFKILVHGPCGSPAGTFDEEWIAVGRFSGLLAGDRVSTAFTYTAVVRDEGEIAGTIRLGPEVVGEVDVRGRFTDGRLTYAGWLGW